MNQFNLSPLDFSGRTLIGSDQQPIGQVSGLFLGHHSDLPRWIAVTCEDNRQHVVPFTQTEVAGPYVKVAYSSQYVSDSATVVPSLNITADQERRLYEHYGLQKGNRPLDPSPGSPSKEDPIGTERAASGSPRFYNLTQPTGAPFGQTQIDPVQAKGPPPDEKKIGPE
jgi:hypothetical protein